MSAGAHTFSLDDTFIEPQVLEPPPTRHALFLILLALASLLLIGTAGWGDLHDGAEGQLAGGAREMLASRQWLMPTVNDVPQLQTPPLLYWLIIVSYKVFGVTVAAARLPVALAMVLSVALTFLIGERLAGYWRGFAAGLIYLCSCGTFIYGRMLTPEPVFSLFFTAAIFCLVCGYQRRRYRRAWFAALWFCLSLACLTKGIGGLFYLLGICCLLAVLLRDARLRLSYLFHWSYLLIFILTVGPWYAWLFSWPGQASLSRWQFVLRHLAWWFPASILVLPGLLSAFRKVIRIREFCFRDVLLLSWMAVMLVPLVLTGDDPGYASMGTWSAFALWAATVWDRSPQLQKMVALLLLILCGAAGSAIAYFTPRLFGMLLFREVPMEAWLPLRPILEVAGISLFLFALVALYLQTRRLTEIALPVLLLSMVPIGLCLTEGSSRVASFYSLANAARFLNPILGPSGKVVLERPVRDGSSLSFYLKNRYFVVNQPSAMSERAALAESRYLNERSVLESWERADPVYLIISETRIPHWQALVTQRVHIYHQVATCGRYVVLSNAL